MSNALQYSLATAIQRRPSRDASRRRADAAKRPARVNLSPIPKDRAHDFSLFASIATRFFRAPQQGGRRWAQHQRMKSRTGYHVAPGLRDAGLPSGSRSGVRFFEVYYGAREVQSHQMLNNDRLSADWRATEETGAALLYRQGDDGSVTVYLYPAKTNRLAPAEDAILLERIRETAALTGTGLMMRHWRILRAYAEVTSLDGEPTPAERAQIAFLRMFRPQIRDGRTYAPEAWRTGLTLAALTVASGFGAAAFAIASAVA